MEKTLKQEPSNCIKIVLFGPESTGKTTLSKQLSEYYKTVWVPEYARAYLERKLEEGRGVCTPEDLLPIAYGQIELENSLVKNANKVLISDTDLLETKTYSEIYFNEKPHPLVEEYALKNTYDLYLLTGIDVPWKRDSLRDKPHERKMLYSIFKNALIKHKRPFVELFGDKETRLQKAVQHIDKLLIKNQ